MTSYDYVVVGAGTAGCVLATRLSEDDSVRVLLLEAGAADGPASMADPVAWTGLLGTEVDWARTTVAQAGAGGVEFPYPAGKVLGGSSSINGTFHLRGHRANYDAWAASGATGWGYEDLLPYFMRSERAEGRDPRVRGMHGPMVVAPPPRTPNGALIEDLFATALDAGIPITLDPNGAVRDGAGWHDWNVVDGKRQSAADAYLRPVLNRPNLSVVTEAQVRRLIVENGRCRGVEYTAGSENLRAEAACDVVLTAGTVGSAQLLMTSGIGPASHLRDFGIDVVIDAPGVGQNLQDHPLTCVVFKASEAAWPAVREHGINSFNAMVRTDPAAAEPDILLVFGDGAYYSPALDGPSDAYVILPTLVKPVSRGSVRLAGADITRPPLIDPNFLGEQADVDRLLAGLRMAREIGSRASLKIWNDGEVFPGPGCVDDAACTEFLRRSIIPNFHPVGTCRMGSDPEAVVDPQLRVRGVEGLRVADASVMPSIVSANTNATVLAIAERAAALIKPGS
jgi:choline dehydrogenase